MSKLASEKIGRLAKRGSRGNLLEVDIKYSRELHHPHNELPFMCEKMVINKVEKLVHNLHHRKNYLIPIRALDQALKYELIYR